MHDVNAMPESVNDVELRVSSKHVPFPSFLLIFDTLVFENDTDSVLVLEYEEVEEEMEMEKRGEEEREICDILTSDELNVPLPISMREEERVVDVEQYTHIPFSIIPPSDALMHINASSKLFAILKSNELSVNIPPLTLTPCFDDGKFDPKE